MSQKLLTKPQILILKIIKFYQTLISPNMAKSCRFYPSCSEYIFLAVEKHGALKGVLKGIKRVVKCYPWHPGGIDLP